MKCNHWIATRYTAKGTAKVQFLADKSIKDAYAAIDIFCRFNKTKIEDPRRCDGNVKVESSYSYAEYEDGGWSFDYECDKCKTNFNMPEEKIMIQAYLDSKP